MAGDELSYLLLRIVTAAWNTVLRLSPLGGE
jgi:hypothetical protein